MTAVEVWDEANEGFIPIKPATIYQLATNNFIANGGDDFSMLADASDRYETGWLLSDALAEFLDEHAPVAPATEGRIEESPAATETDG